MPHAIGTNLGGIRTIDDLMGRCFIDPGTGCWHLRTAHGRSLPHNNRHTIWLAGFGCISAPRAALKLRGVDVPKGHVAYRCCTSYDCIFHLGTRSQSEHGRVTGITADIANKTAANRKSGARRSRVDARARARIAYSGEALSVLAREFGICASWAWTIKQHELAKTVSDVRAS